MNDIFKLTFTFVDSTALILALVLVVNILHRKGRSGWVHAALMGGMFAIAVVYTMSDPISLGEWGIFDMRGLLVGVAVALFGPFVGAIALIAGLAMRFNIGEPGMVAGFIGMVCAYGAGLLWRVTIKRTKIVTWKKSVILGVMITAQLLAVFAAPVEMWAPLFGDLLPYTLVTNVLGSLVINHLISGELSFLSEAETTKIEANTDHLTGLLNRRGLDLIYPDLALQKGEPRGRALIYFDIDKFKVINDTHGHSVGDKVLKFIAEEVGRNLRPSDIFARLGGDEFAIVLSRIDKKEAHRIAQRCRSVVEETAFDHQGAALPVTISVGAVWMLEHSQIDQILDEADRALYVAKSKGRNKVIFKIGMAARPVATLTPAAS